MTTLSKDVFPQLLNKITNSLKITNLQKIGKQFSGKQVYTHLIPHNQSEDCLLKKLSLVSTVVIDMLNKMRGWTEPEKKQRRKKVSVEPGKSVSASDLDLESNCKKLSTRKRAAVEPETSISPTKVIA